MNEWRCFSNIDELDRELAQHIAGQLARDLSEQGRASLAVSGGGTPKSMFQQLSQCQLDWSNVWITLVDERWVDPDDEASNEKMVRENLLQNRAAAAKFISLTTTAGDASDALPDVAQRMTEMPQPFSALVLGMGGDGHTASWFPRASNLQDLLDPDGVPQLAATQPVTAPHQRMTLTLPAVLNSRDIIIHITGSEKKAVLESAVQQHYPIAAILTQNKTPATIWWAPAFHE